MAINGVYISQGETNGVKLGSVTLVSWFMSVTTYDRNSYLNCSCKLKTNCRDPSIKDPSNYPILW